MISDRFTLDHKLGGGAVGTVWSAADAENGGMKVAIKFLHGRLSTRPKSISMLAREADTLQQADRQHRRQEVPAGVVAEGQHVDTEVEREEESERGPQHPGDAARPRACSIA